jgi:hypothetical protein
LLKLPLQGIDALNRFAVSFQQPVIAAAEQHGEWIKSHRYKKNI